MRSTTRTGDRVDDIHYIDVGDGPQTVVLLHGFSDNLTTWHRVVPRLAAEHRVIAIDLPGFGRTTRRWHTPLLPGYVDVVRSVLDAEGIDEPVSFVGNSMGAVVSALFARRYPDRTAHVVLIDMPGLRTVPKVWRMAMSRPAEFGVRTALRVIPGRAAQFGLGWAYSHVAAADPRRLDPLVRESFLSPYGGLEGRLADLLPLGRVLVSELRRANLADLVATSSVPVLLVFGSRDLLTPARVLGCFGRPGGAVVIPGCGHCAQIDQPGELLSHVVPFLRQADITSAAVRTA